MPGPDFEPIAEDLDQQILFPSQLRFAFETDSTSLAPAADDRLIAADETFETPTDDRGVVLEDQLAKLVLSTVREDYEWRGEPDIHHMYWKSRWYKEPNLLNERQLRLYVAFRELPVHKLYLPREFHDYLHQVTEPVEPPEEDVMHMRVEGWNVAARLFKQTGDLDRTLYLADNRRQDIQRNPEKIRTEHDAVAAAWYVSMMRKHFRGMYHRIGELEKLPDEFRFVDPELIETFFDDVHPEEIDPDQVTQFRSRVHWIGSVASRRALQPSVELQRAG